MMRAHLHQSKIQGPINILAPYWEINLSHNDKTLLYMLFDVDTQSIHAHNKAV